MAEDDLSDVVGGPEEARGGNGEGSVPQGAVLGPVDWGEKVGISGEWRMAMEEICYVRGRKVV